MNINTSVVLRDLSPLTARLISKATFEDAISIGEWRFLIALLDRAVKDLQDRNVCVRNSARAWVNHSEPAILGFNEVCEFIGLGTEWARRTLRCAGLMGSTMKEPLAA